MKKRIAAEWEPTIGVMLAWPTNIPHLMIKDIASETDIYFLVPNEHEETDCREWMKTWNVPIERIHFLKISGQGASYCWPRDWGPHPCFDETGNFKLLNPRFWYGDPFCGPNDETLSIATSDKDLSEKKKEVFDDEAPKYIAKGLGLDVEDLEFAFTGGNIFSDGVNNVISSKILLMENAFAGVSNKEFFQRVNAQTGMSQYTIIPNFEDFSLQHVDCLMKMLDEERILVARPPKGHPHYELYDHIAYDILGKTLNCYGRPYEILRLDTDYHQNGPKDFGDLHPYVNAVILNKSIYVPLGDIPQDEIALQQWQEAMPGYNIKGFYSRHDEEPVEQRANREHPDAFPMGNGQDAGWLGFDAVHCRTRAVWDPKMLHIDFPRIPKEVPEQASYDLNVRIVDYSKAGLIKDQLNVFYRKKGEQEWKKELLTESNTNEIYHAELKAKQGDTIEYYVSAADKSGRVETRPAVAPNGFFAFHVH